MKRTTLTKVLTALTILCFGVTVAFWLRSFDVVLGQLGDNPSWRVILCPHDYFFALYGAEVGFVLATIWAYRREGCVT